MADNASLVSLATFDTVKTSSAKETGTSRFRTSGGGFSSAISGKGGFDGFLKTFLGEDKSSSSNRTGLSRGRNSLKDSGDKSSFLEELSDEDDKGVKRGPSSREHIEIQEDALDEISEEAMAEAARYAWEIVCGQLDAMSSLDSIGGLTAGVVESSWLQDAMIGTNANSLVNSAAVFSAVEDVIGEMSDGELSQALAQTLTGSSDGADSDMDAFNRMASELNARVVAINEREDLLASLAGGSVYSQETLQDLGQGLVESVEDAGFLAETTVAAANTADSAETTGIFAEDLEGFTSSSEIFEEFSKFIKEKLTEDPTWLSSSDSPEQAAALVESFSQWLSDNGNINNSKQIGEHPNKFIQELVSKISSQEGKSSEGALGTKGIGEIFSQIKTKLETLLRNNTGMKANETSGLPFGQQDKKLNQGIFEEISDSGITGTDNTNGHGVASAHSPSSSIPSLSRADSSNPAAMSTMLDQIENIERIAEAVKMANRSGVKNLTIQLTPDELGKVILKVEARNGVVNAYLRVERPEAVAQLGQSLSQLRDNLKAAGVEMGEISIEQRSFNEMAGNFGGGRQGGGSADESGRNRIRWSREREAEKSSVLALAGGTQSERNALGGLNFLA